MKSGLLAALALCLCASSLSAAEPPPTPPIAPNPKARLFVLTDIEADPDDTQSLIRLLLYANDIDIEGLVATTSVHKKAAPAPTSIRDVIANTLRSATPSSSTIPLIRPSVRSLTW